LFLLIFESIGTSELIMIAIVALVFLGPRKLPQIARTIGKTMADFRSTTNEFKSTWEREVNFEDEERALKTGELPEKKSVRADPYASDEESVVSAPEIREIDKSRFDDLVRIKAGNDEPALEKAEPETEDGLSDKRSWL